MSRTRKLMLLAAALITGAQAESKWLKVFGYVADGANCALSGVDAYQSYTYLDGKHGLREANGFLANPDGTIRVGRMIGFKIGMCGLPLVLHHIPWHHEDTALPTTIVSATGAAVFTYVDIHNYHLIEKVSH